MSRSQLTLEDKTFYQSTLKLPLIFKYNFYMVNAFLKCFYSRPFKIFHQNVSFQISVAAHRGKNYKKCLKYIQTWLTAASVNFWPFTVKVICLQPQLGHLMPHLVHGVPSTVTSAFICLRKGRKGISQD